MSFSLRGGTTVNHEECQGQNSGNPQAPNQGKQQDSEIGFTLQVNGLWTPAVPSFQLVPSEYPSPALTSCFTPLRGSSLPLSLITRISEPATCILSSRCSTRCSMMPGACMQGKEIDLCSWEVAILERWKGARARESPGRMREGISDKKAGLRHGTDRAGGTDEEWVPLALSPWEGKQTVLLAEGTACAKTQR